MAKLLFAQVTPAVELEAKPKVELRMSPIITVGIFLLLFLGVAIAFYRMSQPEAGRLVIDIAVAFLTWVVGRTTGETAGTQVGIDNG